MAKRPRRSAFPTNTPNKKEPQRQESILADESVGGIYGFFRDIGVRETIESIIVAVVLAFMFRAYEAEAFIIPTGSMAPSLQGQHMDLHCEQCGVQYRAGASGENSITQRPDLVNSTYCPICQYKTKLRRNAVADHVSNNGDRILVNKFIYDFVQPQRYDVIVFKNPNNGKQNYIKRLIGLPGDNILIENGDIYLMDLEDGRTRVVSRKPPRKLRNVLQTVDDTNFIGEKLKAVEWPSRWKSFGVSDPNLSWDIQESDGKPLYHASASNDPKWMRYRHFQPLKEEWPTIESGNLPSRFDGKLPLGALIGDKYSYNDPLYTSALDGNGAVKSNHYQNLGNHWVGDLGLECWLTVKNSSGNLLLDVVEGGAHFTCSIDVATGVATLSCDDSKVDSKVSFEDADGKAVASPTGKTNLRGAGSYRIEYVNADDQIHLWVNNRLIEFDAAQYRRDGVAIPTFSPEDAGDAEPVGIGVAAGLEVDATRLKILRDIYYTSRKGGQVLHSSLSNESGMNEFEIQQIQRDPESWTGKTALKYFTEKKGETDPMFKLKRGETAEQDQFLPMGDNSPESLDGRVWDGEKYVERDMLIGRAMLIYWPHTLNSPIKYFPNFGEMGFIR